MEVERATGQNLQFLTPFVGCTLALLAPTYILWKARSDVDAAEAAADQDEKEEVEVSLSQELRRMKSVINKPVLAAVLATVVTSIGQDARDRDTDRRCKWGQRGLRTLVESLDRRIQTESLLVVVEAVADASAMG